MKHLTLHHLRRALCLLTGTFLLAQPADSQSISGTYTLNSLASGHVLDGNQSSVYALGANNGPNQIWAIRATDLVTHLLTMFTFPKTTLFLVCCLLSIQLSWAQRVPVYRFFHPVEKDWVTLPKTHTGYDKMVSYGYEKKEFLFYAFAKPGDERVEVFRLYQPQDQDWVTVSEDYEGIDKMAGWGYKFKESLFYAYRGPGPGRVAVNNWWHPGDRDWLLVPETRYTDAQLTGWGYEHKRLEFYVDRQ